MVSGLLAADGTQRSLIFTLAWETMGDLEIRGWNRPPDRLICELLGAPDLTHMAVAEPSRNPLIAFVRSPLLRSTVLPPALLGAHRYLFSPHHFGLRRPVLTKVRFSRYGKTLQTAARAAGFQDPVVITSDPRIAAFSDLDFAARVVYFARDDWACHHAYRSLRSQILKAYEELRARRIDVAAVSNTLLRRLAPTGRALLLPNGVEPSEWLAPGVPPKWFDSLPCPRFLYVGTVDARIDLEWIERITNDFPEASVVLAGPNRDHTVSRRLAAMPGVTLPGNLYDRADVTSLVLAADVCLLPHVRSELTEAMDPLKLYEYLAAGRPVVATDLAPVRAHSENVVLVSDASQLRESIERALTQPAQPEEMRLSFLKRHSWKARAQTLLRFAFAEGS